MSKSDAWETALLQLVFQNANVANVGDATGLRGSSAAGSLFVSLHTSDPGDGGSQTTNEAAYTSYARVAVARSAGGFAVSGNAVQFAANVVFPVSTGGTPTLTHFGIGTASSGAGTLLYKGAISPTINVTVGGNAPTLLSGTNVVTED